MMSCRWIVLAVAVVVMPCAAQSSGGRSGVPGTDPPPPVIGNDRDVGVNQLKQFGIYDVFKDRVKQSHTEGKSLAELLAEDKADATALAASMKLSCGVSNAVLVAVDDKAKTRTYEVACDNGTGYFLVRGDTLDKATGFTCFAADAARQADIAAHREPTLACGLPENPGPKAMAGSILSRAGKVCSVTRTKWLGQSPRTDYLEVACQSTQGFVVASPLPGSQLPLQVKTCGDAAASGISCRLPENDTTLAAFKVALARYNVPCEAEAVHVIGHESLKQRQVVEFLCPRQQPKGLVVFLPAEGSIAPFEAVDCAAAAKRQAMCTLSKQN